MIYEYKCEICNKNYDVFKYSKDSSVSETCPDCFTTMVRQFSLPYISVKESDYYHLGLGKTITNNSQVSDELKKYTDTTGKELIELGNERLPENLSPESKYDLSPREHQEVNSILESAGVSD